MHTLIGDRKQALLCEAAAGVQTLSRSTEHGAQSNGTMSRKMAWSAEAPIVSPPVVSGMR